MTLSDHIKRYFSIYLTNNKALNVTPNSISNY